MYPYNTGSTNFACPERFSKPKNRLYYYPFGMLMPERHASTETYSYGFNGMEKDDEVAGQGNSYTTTFRQYDTRLGRWKSLDPLMAQFPHQSGYVAFDNSPVFFNDPKGLAADGPGDEDESTDEDGRSSVTIDKNDPARKNMWQIAGGDNDRLEQLYEWNPGTRENHNNFVGGEKIYTSEPNAKEVGPFTFWSAVFATSAGASPEKVNAIVESGSMIEGLAYLAEDKSEEGSAKLFLATTFLADNYLKRNGVNLWPAGYQLNLEGTAIIIGGVQYSANFTWFTRGPYAKNWEPIITVTTAVGVGYNATIGGSGLALWWTGNDKYLTPSLLQSGPGAGFFDFGYSVSTDFVPGPAWLGVSGAYSRSSYGSLIGFGVGGGWGLGGTSISAGKSNIIYQPTPAK